MPKITKDRLSDTAIRKAKREVRQYKLFDGQGLFVLVHPNGSKYFRWRYHFAGKERTLAVGVYPLVSLAEARQKVLEAKRELGQGIDPVQRRREQKIEMERKKNERNLKLERSFKNVTELWMETHHWSRKHGNDVRNSLKTHVFPRIGELPVSLVTKSEVRSILLSVQDQGKFETAHRIHQRVRAIFKFAMDRDWCERNYAQDLDGILVPVKPSSMLHIPINELPEYLRKLEENKANLHRVTLIALKIMVYASLRTQELRMAKWNDLDFEGSLWRFPAEVMKNDNEHLKPMSRQTKELLIDLQSITGHGKFVFPGDRNPDNPMSNNTLLYGGIYRMGYKGQAHIHGFRALQSTILNESGRFNPDAIEREQARTDKNKVRAIYNRAEYLNERREMIQWYADHLDGLKSKAKQ